MSRALDPDELFACFQRTGDPASLGAVYDLVAPELLRVALHLTRDSASAEDALQATFVTAIERARSFDSTRRVLPWLVGILANHAKAARARAERAADPRSIARGNPESPAVAAELAELDARLDEALARLPEAYRPVLVLRIRHGLSATEIAHALGKPSGTVRSELARGIELLRRVLPASFAGAGIVSLASSARGLGAVRESVLAHAAAVHAPLAVPVAVAGALAMKKLIAAACAVVLALVVAWRLGSPPSGSAPLGSSTTDATTLARDASAVVAPELERAAADREREELVAARPLAAVVPPSTSEPARALARLTVRAVREEDGAPVSGEIVLVRTVAQAHSDESLAVATDERGVARFVELEPGRAFVRLLRGGEDEIDLAVGQEGELELRVRAGIRVRGRVVDAQRAPIAGAEVWLSERYSMKLGYFIARSGEDGRFVLPSLGMDHGLAARARGYAMSDIAMPSGTPGDEAELELVLRRESAPVRGRVLDDRGLPVARARVMLGEENPRWLGLQGSGGPAFASPPLFAETDAQGEFGVEGAPFGIVPVQVRARGFGSFSGSWSVEANARGSAAPVREVRLVRAARVRGEVRDELRQPVASACARVGAEGAFAGTQRWTMADGRFELSDVTPGDVRVEVRTQDGGHAELEVRLAPGEVYAWNVELARTPVIFGTLTDDRGAPVAGWTVVAYPGGDRDRRARSTPTDARGAFTIGDVGDEEYTLWVHRPAGWRAFPSAIVESVRPSNVPVAIRLAPPSSRGGRITATVLGPDREPVTGAELEVWHATRAMWRSFVVDGETGRVEIEEVPAGVCTIDVKHASFPWMHVGEREVRLGETLDLGEIVLADGGRVRGRLTGVSDSIAAGASVLVVDPATHREVGSVQIADGEYRTSVLADGRYQIVVRGDSIRMQELSVDARAGTETTLDVVLARCASRRVAVELPEGAPKPQWISIRVFASDGQVAWFGAIGAGQALETTVSAPSGSYVLWASTSGELSFRGPFTIEREDGGDPVAHVRLAR